MCSPPLRPSLDSEKIGKGTVTELIQHRQFTEPRGPALARAQNLGEEGWGASAFAKLGV